MDIRQEEKPQAHFQQGVLTASHHVELGLTQILISQICGFYPTTKSEHLWMSIVPFRFCVCYVLNLVFFYNCFLLIQNGWFEYQLLKEKNIYLFFFVYPISPTNSLKESIYFAQTKLSCFLLLKNFIINHHENGCFQYNG